MFIISILLHYCYILGAIYKYIATIILVLKISSMGSYLLTRPRALEIIEPALILRQDANDLVCNWLYWFGFHLVELWSGGNGLALENSLVWLGL